MKFCKWNEVSAPQSWRAYFSNSNRALVPKADGNPFLGEPLTYTWETVRDGEVAVAVTLPKDSFLDSVVIRTSEATALRFVRLLSDGILLSEHVAETGKTVTEHVIELKAGVCANEMTLLFSCDFSELSILSVELYGTQRERVDLFPCPESVCFGEGSLSVQRLTSFTACTEAAPAGRVLAEKLLDIAGISMLESSAGVVNFTLDPLLPADGYRLEVTETGIVIKASGTRGFVMGTESVIKLIEDGKIPTVTVEDAPFMPFRGVHLMVPSREQMPFAKRLIKHVISPLGYNAVILELAGLGMRLNSHPQIAETVENAIEKSRRGELPPFPHGECVGGGKVVEKETLKEFVDYIRSFGIEVIPEVQSLGHVQFMTYTYPEIAELDPNRKEDVDVRLADALPAQVYPHCYCTSNPRSYEILFDILDEVIELLAPLKYVHIGHDEVYQIGVCPKCRGKDPAELFYSDVMRIYDYLAARGIKTMMWADMLQPVTAYKTWGAASKLPRDIVMLDFIWYFHLDKDIEDNLLTHGYRVAVGNLYASHFPRYETRIRKSGMIGGEISTWVATDEEAIQKEGKFYDFYMVAEMLWDRNYSHLYCPSYDRMIAKQMPRTREGLKGIFYPSLRQSIRKESLLSLDGVRFVPQKAEKDCQSLIFTHTLRSRYSRLPWKAQECVGTYRLTYSDGTEQSVAIRSGREVGYCGMRSWEALEHPLYRHNGYTACYECDRELDVDETGKVLTRYRYEHLLLQGKELVSVEWVQNTDAADLEVAEIEGVWNASI